jgi:MYXO-CTERM domain-containing protein
MSHDPNRSNKVTTFEAGSTITVRVEEYVNHSGRFRVAFDDDGADLTDFNAHVLLDVADDKPPQTYEFQVKLPSTPCENCTLQVIQVMDVTTTSPVADPAPDSTYYNCADIRLVAPGTLGDAGSMPPGEGSGGTASTTGTGGSASTGGTGNLGGMSPSGLGGRSGSAGASMSGGSSGSGSTAPGPATGSAGMGAAIPPVSKADDDGGCSFEPNAAGRTWAWGLAPLALVLAASTRRRRSARG